MHLILNITMHPFQKYLYRVLNYIGKFSKLHILFFGFFKCLNSVYNYFYYIILKGFFAFDISAKDDCFPL